MDYKPDAMEAYTSHYYQFDPSRPFAERLGVGDWYIDHRDVGEQVMRTSPFYGEFLRGLNVASVMSCLIERHPTYEIYLSLQRPLDANVYAEADALALDWVIPHLRDAIGLRERMQELAARGRLSEDMLNRLPFGVVVFDLAGKPLFANQSGEPWVRRLMQAAFLGPRASRGRTAPSGSSHGRSPRCSAPWPRQDTLQAAQAIQATGPDGRTAQIVSLALAPMAQSPPGMETHYRAGRHPRTLRHAARHAGHPARPVRPHAGGNAADRAADAGRWPAGRLRPARHQARDQPHPGQVDLQQDPHQHAGAAGAPADPAQHDADRAIALVSHR